MIEATELLEGFSAAAIRVATPLALAALGETLTERAGLINLGIEGAMLSGALAAAIGAQAGGPAAGILMAIMAGTTLAGIFAAFVVWAETEQIITGTALTLLAVGLTGAIYRQHFGSAGAGLTLPTLPPLPLPVLGSIPVIGAAFFRQPITTYVVYLLAPLCWLLLFRTRWGLGLRALGEAPPAARAAGVRVSRTRTLAVLAGGALAGLAGGELVLAQVGTFAEQMTAGRGFVAIAIVVLGAWQPLRVAAAALLFGGAAALQYVCQAIGWKLPYQLFLMLPYGLTLLALAGRMGQVRAPAALGQRPATRES